MAADEGQNGSVYSPDEARVLMDAFGQSDWDYLFRQAKSFARLVDGVDPEELADVFLVEAIKRTLKGTRKCPRDVPLRVFLVGAMWSQVENAQKARANDPLFDSTEVDDVALHLAARGDWEKGAREFIDAAFDLVKGDEKCTAYLVCKALGGMNQGEICNEMGIEMNELEAIKKRVARAALGRLQGGE